MTRLRILVCDDDCDVLYWLEKQLFPRGIEVLSTYSGDEAMCIYRRERRFDLVLTDYQFGRGQEIKDGLDLVAAIRKIDQNQKVVMHTSDPELRAPCPVLVKPYPLPQLLRLLRSPIPQLLSGPLNRGRAIAGEVFQKESAC